MLNGDVTSTGILAAATGGTLRQNGGTVSAAQIDIAASGNYDLDGGSLEATAINGDFFQDGGTFAAGIGTASSTITGNYTLNTGAILEFALDGTSAGQFDQLFVTGNLSLTGGSLSLQPDAGLSITAGDVFDIVDVGGAQTGTFSGLLEGDSITVGGDNLFLTYLGGDGNDISLVSLLTGGSSNYLTAGTLEVAYVAGNVVPPGGSTATFEYEGLDVLAGSSFELGVNETLLLDGGNGTLNVTEGAVFTGNGIVQGNIFNQGLVRIPLAALPVENITGGHVEIVLPDEVAVPIPTITPPAPMVINENTRVSVGSSLTHGGGGYSGGGGGGGGTRHVKIAGAVQEVKGTFAVDASLEVTGSFTQTETGALRLFVGGNDPADFGVSKSGGSYSQLYVGEEVSLDGALQIVLRPELVASFGYDPMVGDVFDFVLSDTSVSLEPGLEFQTLVTAEGAALLSGLTLMAFNSGISSDPDTLFQIQETLFGYSLINGGKTLRGTLIQPLVVNPVPVPAAVWLFGSALGLLGWLRRKPG